jgi:hypothetical protein
MTFATGLASVMLLSLPVVDSPSPVDEVQVGIALVCDTQQQVERYVAVYDGDAGTAVRTVNDEEHDPNACGMASMAYMVSPPVATARSKDATFQIVKVIVVGLVTDKGVQPVRPAPFFSILEVDERIALQNSAQLPAAG